MKAVAELPEGPVVGKIDAHDDRRRVQRDKRQVRGFPEATGDLQGERPRLPEPSTTRAM